ncbi:SDR family oxidoreductase [Jannaschia rubra]|uniref:2-(S)-hydroxypropyl-CoM dehydrogenase n=1 Tax=Jannaschia rubra TaxID=282197 RepID=A0A0M6XPP4_9RHOB|nr:SDR family oxidoreductase [Jannaschia rubra]CTQ32153.1 2-(S)-hydroxypropyl-CoM dehydrogenase [Jannaschia rubra]SFG36404.1 NAD(P)-dependent dehydrogenase, short-chain alcohol dehydrogenase family [Jannaschia rubra]
MEIETRTALVTGAGGLIGADCVAHLLAQGWRVAALDRDRAALERLGAPAGGDLLRLEADVADESAVARALAELDDWAGQLDLLVNNAGIADPVSGAIEDLSLDDWNRRIAVNLTGPFLMTKHCVPLLRAAKGSIVNVASTRAIMSEPQTEAYAAAKGGLVALTHATAISLGPDIRVNAVAPGWISDADDLSPADHVQHPAGRVGTPRDVAEAVAYLAGAGFVTGAVLVLDGGMTRKMIYAD